MDIPFTDYIYRYYLTLSRYHTTIQKATPFQKNPTLTIPWSSQVLVIGISRSSIHLRIFTIGRWIRRRTKHCVGRIWRYHIYCIVLDNHSHLITIQVVFWQQKRTSPRRVHPKMHLLILLTPLTPSASLFYYSQQNLKKLKWYDVIVPLQSHFIKPISCFSGHFSRYMVSWF